MGEPLSPPPRSSPTRIILDTDLAMGAPDADIDDGFALALALASPELRVDLVTTVSGNSGVETCTAMTHRLLAVLGRDDVPVVQGAPADGGAAAEIVRRVLAEPGEITLVAIGPLTNLARALEIDPRLAHAVREIVVMGGVYLEQTNVAAMPGEYNFWCDPAAAQVVLDSGAPLRLVGLDVTRRVRFSRADADRLAELGEFGRVAAEATHGWIDFQERAKPREEIEQGSCALHDPLAVAAVLRPDLITWREARVDVETESRLTRGVAVADLLMWAAPPTPNCRIATAVDAEGFRELFLRRVETLP